MNNTRNKRAARQGVRKSHLSITQQTPEGTNNMTDQGLRLNETVSIADGLRQEIDRMERSHNDQPARLAQMRGEVETARKEALAAEPWEELLSSLPTYGADAELIGLMALPTIDGKELFGTRLAFDLLGCCDDEEQVSATLNDYFSMVKDPGQLFLIAFAALSVIAKHVVPPMLEIIEDQASNWDIRVTLADAARNAGATRVDDSRCGRDLK